MITITPTSGIITTRNGATVNVAILDLDQMNRLVQYLGRLAEPSNWIGTLGRGRRSIDAKPVETVPQATAWIRQVATRGQDEWIVFPSYRYEFPGKAEDFVRCEQIGWGAAGLSQGTLERVFGTVAP